MGSSQINLLIFFKIVLTRYGSYNNNVPKSFPFTCSFINHDAGLPIAESLHFSHLNNKYTYVYYYWNQNKIDVVMHARKIRDHWKERDEYKSKSTEMNILNERLQIN